MIYQAANEKFLDISRVTEKPANEFLMYINYYIRKQELEKERINKINATNR
jgi:hypothetical protein